MREERHEESFSSLAMPLSKGYKIRVLNYPRRTERSGREIEDKKTNFNLFAESISAPLYIIHFIEQFG